MRSIFRSVLVALVAVVALGAVGAASASAHEYFIEGKSIKALGLKEEAISFAQTGAGASFYTSGPQVHCSSVKGSGTVKEGGAGTAAFTLSECAVVEPVQCTVAEPISIKANSGLTEFESKLADEFTPTGNNSEFGTTIEIRGNGCGGPIPLAGQFTGLVKSEAEQEVETLTISSVTGSELENGVILTMKVGVKLNGANAGKKWSAKK